MAAVVTTSASTYAKNSVVVVHYTGMPGNATDWIAIAPDGSALSSYYAWVYTDGAVDGYAFFIVPNGGPNPVTPITPGNYVARGFENNTLTLADESPAFAVRDGVSGTKIFDGEPPDHFSLYSVEQRLALVGNLVPLNVGSANYSFCTCEAGTPTIHTEGITANPTYLDVEFSDDVVLSGPALESANWYVTLDGPGREVAVGSIAVVSSTVVRVFVTPQTLDATYTLRLPQLGITSASFGIFTGLYSLDFLGVPTVVSVQMVKTIDARTVDVIFAIAVDETTASDPLNYSVSNGLEVTAARKLTDHWYRLTTTRQTNDVVYTFIATNIEPK